MEQFYKIKYSGVIATLLLYKREITAIDIINFCSKISDEYEVIDDGIQDLFECVEVDSQFNFRIKKYLDYYSILRDGKTVLEFNIGAIPVTIDTIALSTIVGIALNLILPKKKEVA